MRTFNHYIILLCILFSSLYAYATAQSNEGFLAGTVVLTDSGFSLIENLNVGDSLVSLHNDSICKELITNMAIENISEYVMISTNSAVFRVGNKQQFYLPIAGMWACADTLKVGDLLLGTDDTDCYIIGIEKIAQPATSYKLTTSNHTFHVTESCIYVHNAAPLIATALIATPPITPVHAGVILGLSLAILCNHFKNKKINLSQYSSNQKKEHESSGKHNPCKCGCGCLNAILCTPLCGCKQPNKTNEDSFLEQLKKRSDKKARHKRFGTLYRDPQSKLWWSKDLAQHGGSQFKVFRETARGLEWVFDADIMGNQILSKYKGPIGKFIPFKEMIIHA